MYVRGHEEDYNAWRVPGWTFAELLPFFQKVASLSLLPSFGLY